MLLAMETPGPEYALVGITLSPSCHLGIIRQRSGRIYLADATTEQISRYSGILCSGIARPTRSIWPCVRPISEAQRLPCIVASAIKDEKLDQLLSNIPDPLLHVESLFLSFFATLLPQTFVCMKVSYIFGEGQRNRQLGTLEVI